jgi:hypothetical protein
MNRIGTEVLAQSVHTLLNSDASLKSMCPYIFKKAPNTLNYPYLEIGDTTEIKPSWDVMGVLGHELTINVHIYALNVADATVTALGIADKVARILTPAELSISGYWFNGCLLEFNSQIPDLSGANKIIHVVSRYRYLLTEG